MDTNAPIEGGTVTGFFDDRASAESAIGLLVAAGITRSQITLTEGNDPSAARKKVAEPTGFWDTLQDFFFPEEDRFTYAEALHRGGYLVSVRTKPGEYSKAVEILDAAAINLAERETAWRAKGWKGWDQQRDVIPVVEEELQVGKRDTSHGRVKVRSYVVEQPIEESVNLRDEHVTVTRRPVDRPARPDDLAFQDRTVDVEERAEEAVVAKQQRVKEEVVVGKTVENRQKTVTDTVRKTKVDVQDERTSRRGST